MTSKMLTYIPGNVTEKCGFDSVLAAMTTYIFTPVGRSSLHSLEPVTDESAYQRISEQSREMLSLLDQEVPLSLIHLDEIGEWIRQSQIEGTGLPIPAFTDILKHARTARLVRGDLDRRQEECPQLWAIASGLEPLQKLEREINTSVSEQGEILDSATPELKSIRKQIRDQRSRLRSTIEKIYRKATRDGMASDEGPTIRAGRMVIPIRAEFKRKIEGFVHDLSSSGQTVYLEPVEALNRNNDIRQLELAEKREIEAIIRRLTRTVAGSSTALQQNSHLLGQIDLIHSRCRLGISWNGTLPQLSGNREWTLISAYSPALILKNRKLRQEDRTGIISLDLDINQEEQGLVISGPNAGGKSVTLKTVALLAIMHQCGIPLPLEPESSLPLIDSLCLDLGDEQSIEQDLSTFSSRLAWMKQVLDRATSKSLILIDEAGTGTDPDEGSALFRSFMEQVLEQGAQLIATTHHGALKLFANEHPALENAAMEFDQETLTPTYRFRKGIPGSSYAFDIASRMNLSPQLLSRARDLLGTQRDRMAEMLLTLEQELQAITEERSEIRKLKLEAEEEKQSFEERSEKLDRERDALLKRAYEEADRIMADANRSIEKAVEQIQSADDNSKSVARRARLEVDKEKAHIRSGLEKHASKESDQRQRIDKPLKVGDTVQLRDGDSSGELVELDGNHAVILVNGLRIKTASNKLVHATAPPARQQQKVRSWKQSASTGRDSTPLSTTLDIRGMRSEEALQTLTGFIDRVVMRGLNRIEIIHGKGEGILRKWVHEYLESREEVTDFEEAPIERGGSGCTIVHLN